MFHPSFLIIKMNFITAYSPLYLIPITLLALGYSYLLYYQKNTWAKWVNYSLAGLRFALVFLIAFLFLSPSSKYINYYKEKPILAIALDNSQSLSLVFDSSKQQVWKENMQKFSEDLEKGGYAVKLETFEDSISNWAEVKLDYPQTDLNFLIEKSQNMYRNQNLSGIFLLSDGIYNQGLAPNYNQFKTPIYTLALGDTNPQIDIFISTVYTNKIAYLGNQFPIVAEIINKGILNQKTELKLLKNNKIIDSQIVNFKNDYQVQKIRFLVKSNQKGIQHYKLMLSPIEGEISSINNIRDVFVEVLDNKEQILILALTPHPDLRALQKIISQKSNYELDIQILSMDRNTDFKIDKKYDLAILHQIPNKLKKGDPFIKILKNKKIPIWYIWGNQSDLIAYDNIENNLKIKNLKTYPEKVFPIFNENFDKFQFSESQRHFFDNCPPISTFFTDYTIPFGTNVILYQKVNNLKLERPLLIINKTEDYKTATLLGEGLWQWDLHSDLIDNKNKPLEYLINTILQYLSVKDDKRKFKVYTSKNRYSELESIDFVTETYNNVYERVFGKKVSMTIINEDTDQKQIYEYVNGTSEFKYFISDLPSGVYNFEAKTSLNGHIEKSRGRFSIQSLQLELVDQQANFDLLRKLSKNTGAQFFLESQLELAKTWFLENKPSTILHSQNKTNKWSRSYWFIILLFFLATLEWIIRKYLGRY